MTEREIDELAAKILKKIQEKQIIINHNNPYQKTILLLKNYNRTKQFVEFKEREISDLKNGVVRGKASTIAHYFQNKTICTDSEYEQRENQIALLSGLVESRRKILSKIDLALEELKGMKYEDIIPKHYFEGYTIEMLADIYDIDIATVKRNRKKQLEKLSVFLFPDEA